MQDKKNTIIRSTIDGTTVTECPTLKSLNTKVWKALRNAAMTTCESPEKFRLVGNFAGGLSVTQNNGFWVAAEKRNASSSSSTRGKQKAILSDAEVLSKRYAIKGMVEAGDPTLQPLIDALKTELAAHDAAVKEQEERAEKAKEKELIKWFSGLPLATQEQIKASATAAQEQVAKKV